MGASLSWYKTNTNKQWQQTFVGAENGYRFHYINLAKNPVLGDLWGFSRFIEFSLFTKQALDLSLRSEIGGAYLTKTFDPTENYQNMLISKHLNFLFGFSLQAEYKIPRINGLGIRSGLSLLHVSNGETRVPNDGFNNLSITGGIFFRPGAKPPKKDVDTSPLNGNWDFSLYPTIGYKEYWRYGGPKYLELSISSEILYSLNRKLMLGAGPDLFFDETIMVYSNHNENPVTSYPEALDLGIHVSALLNISRVQLVLRSGLPVYSGSKRYGRIYNTFGIKYHVSERVFLCMYHKSHDRFYGDNIQWGFGYSFVKGHHNF